MKIFILLKNIDQFDQTWGGFFREKDHSCTLFSSLSELNKKQEIDCDVLIIDNNLNEAVKG